MGSSEGIILFDILFSILLITFGVSTASTPSFAALQSLQSPAVLSDTCISGLNANNALPCIAAGVVSFLLWIGFIFTLAIVFGSILFTFIFSPQFTASGVPFLGLFFIGLQVFVIWDVVSTMPFMGGGRRGV